MDSDLRELLEDLHDRATAVDGHFFTRHPLVIEMAKARDPSLVSTLDLRRDLDRIAAAAAAGAARGVDRFVQAALTTCRAWFEYWNAATVIERRALSPSTKGAEEINAGIVIAAIESAILMSGDPPGWDKTAKRPI